MRLTRSNVLTVLLACLGLAWLTSCGSEEDALAQHYSQAEAYSENEQWAEAVIEYKNVLQIDPNHADAHYGLAKALLQQGEAPEGYWNLRETVRLDPSNHQAMVEYAQISIYAGELNEASKRSGQVIGLPVDEGGEEDCDLQCLKEFPAEPESDKAWLVKGQALEGLKRPAEARVAYEKAMEASPDDHAGILVLANFLRRTGDRDAAEPLFLEAAEKFESMESLMAMAFFHAEDRERSAEAEPYYRRALVVSEGRRLRDVYGLFANYLYQQERVDDAIAVLQEGIETVEEPLDLIYGLARVYSLEDREEEADALIQRATAENPDDPQPHLVLSSYLGRKGDLAGALDAAEDALEVDPDNGAAQLRKAELLIELGLRNGDEAKRDEGRAMVDAVLEAEPSNAGGLFVRSKLELAENDLDAAIQSLRAAIDVRPNWAEAHYLLGAALRQSGQRSAARTELARALEIDASMLEARRLLSQVHADLGEYEYAVEEGQRYLAERPDNPLTRVLVAQSLVQLGRNDEALAEVEKIPEGQRDERIQYALGRIYLDRGENEKARALLLQAHETAPNQAQVLQALLQVEERMGMPEVALERISKAVEENPEDAQLQQVAGLVALAERRLDDAVAHFEKAIELDPDDMTSYRQLANVYVRTGRTAQTIETYQKALEVNPRQPRVLHFLGVLYEMGGKPDLAVEHYEKAIEYDPNLAESKNNLAYLYAERDENLDRALDLAQDAKALMPDDPNTADTLGWVLYRRGVPTAAIGYLKEAEAGFEAGDASLGVIRHHLALAYEASGDVKNARGALDRAIEAYESFAEAQRSLGRPVGADPQWYSDARKMRERL